MKILYVNICPKESYEGHRLFDVEWCENLSLIGDVDLIQPTDDWFGECPSYINKITFVPENHVRFAKLLKSRLLNFGRLKNISPHKHAMVKAIAKYVKKLDSINNYDVIVAAHFDLFALSLNHYKKSFLEKTFILDHLSPSEYLKKSFFKHLYNKKKNKVNHIAMEKTVAYDLVAKCDIKENRVFYIPHPFNKPIDYLVDVSSYDVLGISNSNSIEYVKALIDYEEHNHFFEKKKIKILIRNKEYEYDNGYLSVKKGLLNYSLNEFYSLIAKSKLILAIFPISFGSRTSGTVIDALSYRVRCIGSKFASYLSYCEDYPNACKSFENIGDLIQIIESLLSKNDKECQTDFDNFFNDRNGVKLREYLNQIITKDNKNTREIL